MGTWGLLGGGGGVSSFLYLARGPSRCSCTWARGAFLVVGLGLLVGLVGLGLLVVLVGLGLF